MIVTILIVLVDIAIYTGEQYNIQVLDIDTYRRRNFATLSEYGFHN